MKAMKANASCWLGMLAAAATMLSCYSPRIVECHVHCGSGDICPNGLVCSHGFCGKTASSCAGDSGSDSESDRSDAVDAETGIDVEPPQDGPRSDVVDGDANTDVAVDDAPPDATPDADADATPDADADAAPDADADTAPEVGSDVNPDTNDDAGMNDRTVEPDAGPAPCPPQHYRNVVTNVCLKAHDLNGDGKADAVAVNDAEIDALISDGTKFSYAEWYDGPFYGPFGITADDTTGDGFADAIGFRPDFVGGLRSTGTSFGDFTLWLTPGIIGSLSSHLANVDGDPDGKADAVTVNDRDITVALSTGSEFQPQQEWLSGDFTVYQDMEFADLDGDGRADAIGVGPSSLDVYRSDGASFGALRDLDPRRFAGAIGTFFADVDGDGHIDAVRIEAASIWVALSDGHMFRNEMRWYEGVAGEVLKAFIADADGDGRGDVITFYGSAVKVALSTGTKFAPPTVWYVGQFQGRWSLSIAPAPAGDGL